MPKYLSRRLQKKGRNRTKKSMSQRGKERKRKNDRSRGCGAQARDRKAGGKTAHAPSSSTWRITCCPLLKPPCLHLPPLLRSPTPPRLSSSSLTSHSIIFDSAQPFNALSFPPEPSRLPSLSLSLSSNSGRY